MSEYVLELNDISKDYSGNKVLKHVSMNIKPGEVVSLVGENGAGKSTLMNILFGMDVIKNTGGYQGIIKFNGNVVNIDSPNAAIRLGINMVHQEFMLIDEYSICENVKLNKENTSPGIFTKTFNGKMDRLDKKAMGQEVHQVFENMHMTIDEWVPVHGLSVGMKQFVEIAKALDVEDTKLFIFDEPTAVLTEDEAKLLLVIIEELSSKGISCLFISHRLDEVIRVSDKIIVLRDGEVVSTYNHDEVSQEELAFAMVGRAITDLNYEQRDFSNAPVIMSIKDLAVNMPGEELRGIDLDVYDGEILGIGGLAGSGKPGVANGIHGLFPSSGKVTYKGEDLDISKTKNVLKKHIAFVSEDRKKIGLILDETIENNCILTSLVAGNRFTRNILGLKFKDTKAAADTAGEMIKLLDIRCTGKNQKVGVLSGGNQQKVCIAAMLLQEPEMIFVSEPSRGIDVGAKALILNYLKKINREKGTTIVMTSSELHELCSICDRIAIISEGKLAGIIPANSPKEEFGLLMANITEKEIKDNEN